MDFSAIKDLYIGSTPVQSAWLNGSKVWGRKPAVDEQSIRDAMMLWYDLKKQGATNESMASNPTLRDLSGNGHDATCYNFAWTEESGISTTEYPGALVSDGVDDYCLVEGLPLLNKDDGYTVIAKRKWIGNKGCLSHKRDTVDENGAFQFERYYAQGDKGFTNFSFGEKTGCPIQIDDITYQTTASYNGNVLNVGDLLDNNFLQLFHYGYNVNGGLFSSIALHSFILFNRDLTPDEIQWVKTNLIESEQ